MKKMLKRADGSTSQRGLWDNIRAKAAANKKAGKKGKAPSEDILKAEASIKSKGMGGPGDPPSDTTATKNSKIAADAAAKASINIDMQKAAIIPIKNALDYPRADKLKATLPRINSNSERAAIMKRKTGGKSDWLKESQELKFGGKSKKRMGGKNC